MRSHSGISSVSSCPNVETFLHRVYTAMPEDPERKIERFGPKSGVPWPVSSSNREQQLEEFRDIDGCSIPEAVQFLSQPQLEHHGYECLS